MLVLQRKKNESILLGQDIRISIREIGSDWVKVAIDAPPSVQILRSELAEAAAVNKESAAAQKQAIDRLTSSLKKGKE